MTFFEHLFEIGGFDSSIDLGGLEAGMTEQLLDIPDVRTVLKHVGGAGVTNRMETDVLFDAQVLGQFFDEIEQGITRHGPATSGEEERVCSFGAELGPSEFQILEKRSGSFFAHGNEAFAPTFPLDENEALIEPNRPQR